MSCCNLLLLTRCLGSDQLRSFGLWLGGSATTRLSFIHHRRLRRSVRAGQAFATFCSGERRSFLLVSTSYTFARWLGHRGPSLFLLDGHRSLSSLSLRSSGFVYCFSWQLLSSRCCSVCLACCSFCCAVLLTSLLLTGIILLSLFIAFSSHPGLLRPFLLSLLAGFQPCTLLLGGFIILPLLSRQLGRFL